MSRRFTDDDLREFKRHTESQLDVAMDSRDYDTVDALLARRRRLGDVPPAKAAKVRKTASKKENKKPPSEAPGAASSAAGADREAESGAATGDDAPAATMKQRIFQLIDDLELEDTRRDAEIVKATGGDFASLGKLALRGNLEQLTAVHRHFMTLANDRK